MIIKKAQRLKAAQRTQDTQGECIYKYQISVYHYRNGLNSTDETSLITVELERMRLMKQLVTELSELLACPYKVVVKYLAKLIFLIACDRTYHQSKINLDDALFNTVTDTEIKIFLEHIEYKYNIKKTPTQYKDIKQAFKKVVDCLASLDLPTYQRNEKKLVIVTRTEGEQVNYMITDNSAKHHYQLATMIHSKLVKKYQGPPGKAEKYILLGLIRYETLDSGAEQFVLDLNYRRKLLSYGADFECFGSMFNHFASQYCSLFYDIERYFGSRGSFFALKIFTGIYTANPPFEERMLERMYEHIKDTLLHNNGKGLLIFNILMPGWDDFSLEREIDKDKLYLEKRRAQEKFMNPYTGKFVNIPPYITYIFCADPASVPCKNITRIFLEKYPKDIQKQQKKQQKQKPK